jgi:hypothetical protein
MFEGNVVALAVGPKLNLRKYVGTPVAKQMAYAREYWATQGPSAFKYLPGVDCADFVSQTLLARGWKMNSRWHNYGGWRMSPAWISSTALRGYIASLGRRTATELNDSQRRYVKVGDVAQFDWDRSGDRDHTAVVSKVVRLASGRAKIYVSEHTDPWLLRDVDDMITRVHPGGLAYYWSIH